MKYVSTRGGMSPQPFSEILLEGLAPDGGLAVPESYPSVDAATLEQWRSLSYDELAVEVLSLYISDVSRADLNRLTKAAYDPALYVGETMVPLKPLNKQLSLVGLSQGPTLAFKDMAMQFLGQVFEFVLTQRNATINILGATSGDTGSAAEYALKGKKGVNVFMLSPQGRMSAFQRAQMYSLQDQNIHNLTIKGVFDDCQDIVKQIAGDLGFKSQWRLGAVNSINWARIAAQVVYYFWAWLRATNESSQQVSFAVPSGNFGNILAGHIARQMGLPIRKLVLATNENNVLEEFFRTGIYRPRGSEHTYATSSPSMDISKASNFERFIYDFLGRDPQALSAVWKQLADTGQFDFSDRLDELHDTYGFVAGVSTHADRLSTIRKVWADTGVLIDPHTADGVKVANEHLEPGIPMLVLETALPAKFSETIEEAIGEPAPVPDHLTHLADLPQRVIEMDAEAELVMNYIKSHASI
ncbi:threonine synthase [Paenalcaligenes niemegkensis]|uniref:threonine synthase n=1 Tax=Paenalcaligenes niemegkensis TaxID=2895469 RepID=UPI001EE94446|nr:threonine synthase [Paenalcaligenes niemegkensis]MCQ9615635.1 threonine synthase [Paenalcaligenes niemegkensis]